MSSEKKSIEEREVAVLRRNESTKNVTKFRVVHWIVDGKDYGPQLEKRDYFKDKDGNEKMGKLKGLKKDDLDFLASNWDEVMGFFR